MLMWVIGGHHMLFEVCRVFVIMVFHVTAGMHSVDGRRVTTVMTLVLLSQFVLWAL